MIDLDMIFLGLPTGKLDYPKKWIKGGPTWTAARTVAQCDCLFAKNKTKNKSPNGSHLGRPLEFHAHILFGLSFCVSTRRVVQWGRSCHVTPLDVKKRFYKTRMAQKAFSPHHSISDKNHAHNKLGREFPFYLSGLCVALSIHWEWVLSWVWVQLMVMCLHWADLDKLQ